MEQMMVQAAAPVQGVQGVSFRALQGALAGWPRNARCGSQSRARGQRPLPVCPSLSGCALLAQMGQMQDDAEDEGVELGMQMMAEMLLSGNPQAAQILEQLGLEPEQVQALAQAGQDAGRVAQIEDHHLFHFLFHLLSVQRKFGSRPNFRAQSALLGSSPLKEPRAPRQTLMLRADLHPRMPPDNETCIDFRSRRSR